MKGRPGVVDFASCGMRENVPGPDQICRGEFIRQGMRSGPDTAWVSLRSTHPTNGPSYVLRFASRARSYGSCGC